VDAHAVQLNRIDLGLGADLFTLSQLDDFILDTRGDLTILALQLAQFQKFTCGFGRIAGDVAANTFNVLLDIPKLLCEEDSQGFLSIGVHIQTSASLILISEPLEAIDEETPGIAGN
jgi:hypothetical protein